MRDQSARARIFAKARPNKIAAPTKADVAALSKPEAFDRWKAGIRAATTGDNVITIYDVIGEDFWTGGGVTVNRIDAALRKIGDRDIEVHINSPGGDMFEGIAIYNRLQEHPAKITVKVMGLAASAASIVVMAGDDVQIGAASFLMIHDCWVIAIGNRHDMAETAAFLAPFDDAMASVYAQRSGGDKAEIGGLMDAETWMSGAQAVERGFADSLLPADELAEDEDTSASARELNAVRATELELVAAGHTRASARERINKIKGTPGAARDDATPGAGDTRWIGLAAGLSQKLRS